MAAVNLIFLLDLSGSMTMDGRLNQLNMAIPDVLMELNKKLVGIEAEVSVRVIGFNETAEYVFGSVERGEDINTVINKWQDMSADSVTRTDLAIDKAIESMHARYLVVNGNTDGIIAAPVVILFTDGNTADINKYRASIEALKNTRRRRSGREGILRIAVGVANANIKELEEFASVWPTVTGKDSEGKLIIEDKRQVYFAETAEQIGGILTQLTVSSVIVSSTNSITHEEQDVQPINLDMTSGPNDVFPVTSSVPVSSITPTDMGDFK